MARCVDCGRFVAVRDDPFGRWLADDVEFWVCEKCSGEMLPPAPEDEENDAGARW